MVDTLMKYCDNGEFDLHEYVVMPDHIHVLVSLKDESHLPRAVQLIKGGFSHALREKGILLRAVWQQRYHDRRVRDAEDFAEIAEYIRQNPVRRGLANHPADYPYSSAGKQRGLKPLVHKGGAVDASLKARSTDPSGDADASQKGLALPIV